MEKDFSITKTEYLHFEYNQCCYFEDGRYIIKYETKDDAEYEESILDETI